MVRFGEAISLIILLVRHLLGTGPTEHCDKFICTAPAKILENYFIFELCKFICLFQIKMDCIGALRIMMPLDK